MRHSFVFVYPANDSRKIEGNAALFFENVAKLGTGSAAQRPLCVATAPLRRISVSHPQLCGITTLRGARGPERRGVSATLKPSHVYRKTETRTLWRGFTERARRFCNMKKRPRRARSPETPRHAGPKRIENREKRPLYALIKKPG